MANLTDNPISLVKEILHELRIDQKTLQIMANGYSPNREGVMDMMEGESYYDKFPVLQLSQKLAEDINNIGIDWNES